MFQAALRPQALKCSVARTLQASEEARVTAAAKLFPGIKRLSERVLVQGLARRRRRAAWIPALSTCIAEIPPRAGLGTRTLIDTA